jgi:hypothetical protein
MAFTGDQVTATVTGSFREDTGGSTASTTYAVVGATMGQSFVAPASGSVVIHFATAGFNSGANENKTVIQVRAGGTVGVGAIHHAANDNDMALFVGTATYRIVGFIVVTGLTVGSTYNWQMLHRVSAGTGSWLYRIGCAVGQV